MTWDNLLLALLEKLHELLLSFSPYLVTVLLGVAWCAWWLGGVNWRKLWPALAKGAWLPALLLAAVVALEWTQLRPSSCTCLGFMVVPNGWWQAGAVALLAATALFCGWLQGYFGWLPQEIPVEPPAQEPGHDHGHAHVHH